MLLHHTRLAEGELDEDIAVARRTSADTALEDNILTVILYR